MLRLTKDSGRSVCSLKHALKIAWPNKLILSILMYGRVFVFTLGGILH